MDKATDSLDILVEGSIRADTFKYFFFFFFFFLLLFNSLFCHLLIRNIIVIQVWRRPQTHQFFFSNISQEAYILFISTFIEQAIVKIRRSRVRKSV